MGRLINTTAKSKNWNLNNFYEYKNKVLFYRSLGGLGDILMHRMLFEDYKKMSPETELHFACPVQYHDALKDHPYLDKVVDYQKISLNDYLMWFNTSSCCGRYESAIAPLSDKHRSDIWSEFCGVKLENHEMHIKMSDSELKSGMDLINQLNPDKKRTIALCPISAIASKNLLPHQMKDLVKELHSRDYFVFGLHGKPIEPLTEINVPTISGISIRNWMAVIHSADYVISVDTAAFHMAGGVKKPLTGIFAWADGKTYGKYFDFFLVQRHRDNGDWPCGPCYNYCDCPFTKGTVKPCIETITHEMIMEQVDNMFKKWQ